MVATTPASATPARDVQSLPIGLDTTVLRSRTWERLKFEIEYSRRRGTTANAYLIDAAAIALLDPPGEAFTETFLADLLPRLGGRAIDYLILGHVNPNRGQPWASCWTIGPRQPWSARTRRPKP